MLVRPTTPDDAEAIERIRTDTWRATYRGLMPDAVLDALAYDPSARRQRLSTISADQVALVAEVDGSVVGYCFGGPSRTNDPPYPGEVYAIYVFPQFQGRGVGRALLVRAADELLRRGWHGMLIWVLRENAPSRGFYERMGGRWTRDEERQLEYVTITESGYGWDDVGPLARSEV